MASILFPHKRAVKHYLWPGMPFGPAALTLGQTPAADPHFGSRHSQRKTGIADSQAIRGRPTRRLVGSGMRNPISLRTTILRVPVQVSICHPGVCRYGP